MLAASQLLHLSALSGYAVCTCFLSACRKLNSNQQHQKILSLLPTPSYSESHTDDLFSTFISYYRFTGVVMIGVAVTDDVVAEGGAI